ncbi:MAG TPA: ABC transporter permease subunit [Streptosporangiaceae bacterium]|nr:ABC transporter permease subunit [Streptosporangiaceae bacterium]
MTARTMSARPGEDDSRPLPWRRMAGVTWRQHRIMLAGVVVLLGAVAVWLWTAGMPLHQAYAAAVACHPASSTACQNLAGTFSQLATSDFMGNHGPGGILVQLVPVLIGAFAGAPVLARELETGTFRYAWTQGFGRWRWALAKLVLLAIVLAAATAATGVVVSWYFQPESGTLYQTSPLVTLFGLREVTFPGWTLAAFAIGALAGMLIRRVVPAIVATLAAYAGLAFAAAGFLREHYLTPVATTGYVNPGTSTAWVISQWSTKDGTFAFSGNPPGSLVNRFCSSLSPDKTGPQGFAPCLAQHGYTQWISYQPASRFWAFQWIEGGWLLALAALLIAATIWLVHRRAA